MVKLGIDVSHHQKLIDWGKVAGTGIKFCIMKAMYESTHKPDEYFDKNYLGCVANKIEKGSYIFIGSKSIANPVEDANAYLDILDGRKFEYGVWIDAEGNSLRAIGKKRITEIIIKEASIIEQAGYRVGIYTNPDWYKNVLDVDMLRYKYPFWVGRYPKNDVGNMEVRLSPKEYAEAWQFSSKGKVPGIVGNVDLDIDFSYGEFMQNYKIAEEVLVGKWGSANTNPTRRERLEKNGYSYKTVQAMVNAIYKVRKLQ